MEPDSHVVAAACSPACPVDDRPIVAIPVQRGTALPATADSLLADAETELAFGAVMGRFASERARRLAACWNACLGISTEDLEDVGLGNNHLVLASEPPPWPDQRWTLAEADEDQRSMDAAYSHTD